MTSEATAEAPLSRDAIKAALQSLVRTHDELEAAAREPVHIVHRVNLQQSAARQLLETAHGVEGGRVDALSHREPELPALAEFLPHHALAAVYRAAAEALPSAIATARSTTDELASVRRATANLVELYYGLFGEDVRPCVPGLEKLVPDGDAQ